MNKLDVDKELLGLVNLNKLSEVIKNDVAKIDVYNVKIKNIEDKIHDITNLATKTSLNTKISEVKREIPDTANLATNASLNAKINDFKGKIPNITHCMKSVQIRSFFWPVFSHIWTKYGGIQSKCGKIRIRKKIGIWTLFMQ